MMFFEALTAVVNSNSEMWFRPVSWKNTGNAYAVIDGDIVLVPYIKRSVAPFASVETLMQEWEVVSADTVLNER